MRLTVVHAFLIVLLVGGCASRQELGGSPNVTIAQALPIPERTDLVSSQPPSMIGPLDKLKIQVFGVEELTTEMQVDASGRVSLPLIGTVVAAGKTPEELGVAIADRLRGRYVRDPQVAVNLDETVSQLVTVDGEVEKPGLYPVVGRLTLMRAVATAEGTTEFAAKDDVVIFRTVKGQQMAALFNLEAIRRGQYDDPEVYANDVVLVGESRGRRLFRDVLQLAPAVFTPLIYLVRP